MGCVLGEIDEVFDPLGILREREESCTLALGFDGGVVLLFWGRGLIFLRSTTTLLLVVFCTEEKERFFPISAKQNLMPNIKN